MTLKEFIIHFSEVKILILMTNEEWNMRSKVNIIISS